MVAVKSGTLKELKRAALFSSTILCSGLATPVFAQSTEPSIFKNIDENGVDLTDGSFNFTLTEGVIGSGEGALKLERYIGSSGFSDNLSIRFTRTESGSMATISITVGNSRETFTGSASATTFNSAQGTGAVLTKVSVGEYELRLSDGTTTRFVPPPGLQDAANNGFCSTNNQFSCGLIAQRTERPNGATLTYQWDTGQNCWQSGIDRYGEPIFTCAQFWRQRSVSNSFGYRIRFSFQQEADPSSGLPQTAWHTRAGATFYNDKSGGALASVSYAYPSSTVTDVTVMDGGTWRFTRDANQYAKAIRRPGSSTNDITVARDTNGVVTQVNIDGVVTDYERSVSGSTATMTVTNALSQQTVVTSDLTKGRPVQVRDAENNITAFEYDTKGRLETVTYPEDNETVYSYDARGNITQVSEVPKPGSGLNTRSRSATFPSSCTNNINCNKPTSTTDANGNVTNYTYDPAHGGLLTVTSPADANGVRPRTRYSYQQITAVANQPVTVLSGVSQCRTQTSCTGTANEGKASIGYDSINIRPTSVTRAAGNGSLSATANFGYDGLGDRITIDGFVPGSADTTRIRYDAGRRVVGTVSPDPDDAGAAKFPATRYSYNARGQRYLTATGTVNGLSDADWAAFNETGRTVTEFDAHERPVREKLQRAGGATPSLKIVDTVYDSAGRVECTMVRMHSASWSPLATSCTPTQTTGPQGPDRVTRYTYDALGRVSKVTTGYGTSVAAIEQTLTFTDNGRVATVKDAENNLTTYEYDGFDRLVKTRFPVPTKGANQSSTTDYELVGYCPSSEHLAQLAA